MTIQDVFVRTRSFAGRRAVLQGRRDALAAETTRLLYVQEVEEAGARVRSNRAMSLR